MAQGLLFGALGRSASLRSSCQEDERSPSLSLDKAPIILEALQFTAFQFHHKMLRNFMYDVVYCLLTCHIWDLRIAIAQSAKENFPVLCTVLQNPLIHILHLAEKGC